MNAIQVGHEESNIAVTIVVIQAAVAAGTAPVPLEVQLCPPGREYEGWRRAAIAHLDRKKNALRREPDRVKEGIFQELAEEMLFDERRARQR